MAVVAPVVVIGGNHNYSTYFSVGSGVDGGVLRKIGLWAGESGFAGIRIWLTNLESAQTFGATQGSYAEFYLEDGERITSLLLWGNGEGGRSGGIRIHTSKDRSFQHQMTSWGLKQEYPINVASGICVGARGYYGHDAIGLHALGLAFLNELSFARMTNVRYPALALDAAGIQPVSVRDIYDTNESYKEEREWKNSGSYTVTTSSKWSVTTGLSFHIGVSVEAGLPGLVEVKEEAGWELSVSGTYEKETLVSEVRSWERSGVIPPRHWYEFSVTTKRGQISTPYEATMEIELRNKARFTYALRGVYEGVSYGRLDIATRSGELSVDERSAKRAVGAVVWAKPKTLSHSDVTSTSTTRVRGSTKQLRFSTRPLLMSISSVQPASALDHDHARAFIAVPQNMVTTTGELSETGQLVKGELGGEVVLMEAETTTSVDGAAPVTTK